jgi:hypothetical protein
MDTIPKCLRCGHKPVEIKVGSKWLLQCTGCSNNSMEPVQELYDAQMLWVLLNTAEVQHEFEGDDENADVKRIRHIIVGVVTWIAIIAFVALCVWSM